MTIEPVHVSITTPEFLKRLDRLRVQVRAARGQRPGETLIPRASQPWCIEFESHTEYSPGDDFRYVDWNVMGRLDQLLVKTFTAEREIPYHLFLDTSASMGSPMVDRKFAFAVDLLASLVYVVLLNNDPLRLVALASPEKGQRPFSALPAVRHRSHFLRAVAFLEALSPAGKTYLREAIHAYVAQAREPGVAIIISDFLTDPVQYEQALLLLKVRGYEVKVLHVIGAAELEPQRLFRRGKLFDVENSRERWVSLSQTNLRRYREAQQAHYAAIKQFCHRYQMTYACLSTASSLPTIMTEELPKAGLLVLR